MHRITRFQSPKAVVLSVIMDWDYEVLERATGCQRAVTLVHICDIWTMKLKVINYQMGI